MGDVGPVEYVWWKVLHEIGIHFKSSTTTLLLPKSPKVCSMLLFFILFISSARSVSWQASATKCHMVFYVIVVTFLVVVSMP